MVCCSKCGNVLNEGQKFCGKCGAEVVVSEKKNRNFDITTDDFCAEANATPQFSNQSQNNFNKKKSVKGKVIVVLSTTLVLSIVFLGSFLWFSYSKQNGTKILKELAAGNYDQAVEYYREAYDEVPIELVSNLKQRLKTIISSYLAGDIRYEEAVAEIDAIQKMKIKKLEADVEGAMIEIESIHASKVAFDEANRYFELENYVNAIELYKQVIETDTNYSMAKTQIVTASMKKAEEEASRGDYTTAIATLNNVLEISEDDTDITSQIYTYTETYVTGVVADADLKLSENDFEGSKYIINTAITNLGGSDSTLQSYLDSIEKAETDYKEMIIAEALAEAEEFASTGDYVNAIVTINTALTSYPGNIELSAVLSQYRESKKTVDIAAAIAESDSYVSNKDYTNAISVLEDALIIYPGNSELNAKITEVEGLKPVPLTNFAFADSGHAEICEDSVYDTVGNEYWGNNVIKIGSDFIANGLWSDEPGFITVYLGMEYSTLSGTIACGERTDSGWETNVNISGDGNRLYQVHVSRTMSPVNISIDVTGVEWLEIRREDVSHLEFYLSGFQLEK